jgi:hypothetical protein
MAETAAQKKKRLAAEKAAAAAAAVAAQDAATKAQIGGYLTANFGLTDSILAMDTTGGLRSAMNEIINSRITDPNLAANILAKTDWFQTYGTEVTKRLSQESAAPGVFNDGVAAYAASLKDQAVNSGLEVSDADLMAIARDGYIYGKSVDSSQILNQLGQRGGVSAGNTSLRNLKMLAEKMGVSYPEDWFSAAAESISIKDSDYVKWETQIRNDAKSNFPNLAAQIDAGQDTRTAGAGYISKLAQTFQLDPNQIDLKDPLLQKAFTNVNEKGEPVIPPLWQFEREAKKDDRYFKTDTAVQDMTGLASEIARQFGKI